MSDVRIRLKIAGFSDTGMRRTQNEDHIDFDEDLGIAVLADGMGGHRGGEIASSMAVESILEKLRNLLNRENSVSITSSQLLEVLSNTISDSSGEIFRAAESNPDLKGMGTTVVATILSGNQLHIGHVGDSRLYLFRENILQCITEDHSLIQDLINKGFYTQEEARRANVGHVVTRALGTNTEVEVDTKVLNVQEGDLLLLCSDGLNDMASDPLIKDVLSDYRDNMAHTAKKLIHLANQHGGKDNISVILAQARKN